VSLVETFLNGDVMLRALPMLLRGLVNTFLLAVTAIVIGSVAGILICIGRLYGPRWLGTGRVEQTVEVADIAPTLARFLGVAAPAASEGKPLPLPAPR